jgi:hypothetical protein
MNATLHSERWVQAGRRGVVCATPGPVGRGVGGFTYVEVLLATTILLVLSLALVSSNLFGVRMQEIVVQRQDAETMTRQVMGQLSAEILSAHRVLVGIGDWASVSQPTNTAIQGNALELWSIAGGVTNRVRYYLDTLDQRLKRCVNGAWPPEVVLESVTNAQPAFMKVDPMQLRSAVVSTQATTTDALEGLVQVRFQLSTVGRKAFHVDPGTAFSGNEMRGLVPFRNQF